MDIDYLGTMEDELEINSANALRCLIERVEPMLGSTGARESVAAPNAHLSDKAPRDLVHTETDRERLDAYLLSLEDGAFL